MHTFVDVLLYTDMLALNQILFIEKEKYNNMFHDHINYKTLLI